MEASSIDLFLGSDIGLWILDQVAPAQVRRVVALEGFIVEAAAKKGIRAELGDANELPLEPGRIAVSIHYSRILKTHVLQNYGAVYNLHPGFLPHGRGWYPIFWALYENTPAGATFHEMNVGLDKGPIVAQKEVPHTEADTGGSLFQRVRDAEQALFLEYWPRLVRGERPAARPQPKGGSYRSKDDFFNLKSHAPWQTMSGAQLVRLARCLTIGRWPGLTIELGGQTFELAVKPVDQAAQH